MRQGRHEYKDALIIKVVSRNIEAEKPFCMQYRHTIMYMI